MHLRAEAAILSDILAAGDSWRAHPNNPTS
jgi:hypothetical protein